MTTKTLAFEIGTEEIPAFDLASATTQLEKLVPEAFDAARIGYESIEIITSPRRLIVMGYGMPESTEELVEEYKGPAVAIAFLLHILSCLVLLCLTTHKGGLLPLLSPYFQPSLCSQ